MTTPKPTPAELAMRMAKHAMSVAALSVLNNDPNAIGKCESALRLLKAATAAKDLSATDAPGC